MSTIAVQQQVIPDIFDVRLTAANPPHLRVFCSIAFTSNDVPPVYVPNGSVGGGKYYIDVACTYVAATGTVTVPTFNLISTTDALAPAQNASYTFCLFTSSGQQLSPDPVQSQMYQIRVPATYKSASSCSPLNKCMDWRDLLIFSRGPFNPNLDLSAYTKSEIDAKFAAIASSGAPASEKYVIQVADLAQLPNAFSLGTLGTGVLKNTTVGATGTPSIAVQDVDYQRPVIWTTPLTYSAGTAALAGLAALGTANQIVGMDPTATVYEYKTLSTGTTGADFNIANSAGSVVFNIPTAGAATRGVIANTGTLSLGTQLTFSAGSGSGILVGANATISLGTNVVTSVVNDTNVTGSIAANALTLGWTGTLAKGRMLGTVVYTDQGNTYSAGTQDFTLATALKVPNGAGQQTPTTAVISYDTTANRFGGGINSVYKLFVSPDSTDTFTNKTWNGVAIGTQYGGTGQNWSGSSGVVSINAGTGTISLVTQNGVAFGGASNAISFTSAVAGGILTTSAGSVPAIVAPGVSITVTAGVVNTIQNIRTTDTPQFAAMGLNIGVAAVTILNVLGPTMTTQSDQSVGSLSTGLNLTKNDGNTRTFFDTLIKPTINTGAGNSATTLNVLTVDTINTVTTGVTTNLLRVNYGGANQLNLTSGGALTVATSLAIAGGTALTTTNQTGTGNLVLATSPTLVTPALGVATVTTINGLTISTSTGTLTIANGKTATINNTLTFAGTDATTVTFTKGPTFNNAITFAGTDATTMTFPSSSDTVVTLAASQTLTNKTLGTTTTVTGPVTMTLGSDATGDIYYRNSSGILTRLAVGTGTQFIGVSGGIPTWATPAGTGGTINSASTNQLAFYTAATTISGNTGITTDGSNDFFIAPTLQTSGSPNLFKITGPAHTTLASVEDTDVQFALNRTVQFTGSATPGAANIATVRAIRIDPPTYAFSSSGAQTIATAATMQISGPPAAGTNATITVPLGFWVADGGFQLGPNTGTNGGATENDSLKWLPYQASSTGLMQMVATISDGNGRAAGFVINGDYSQTLTSSNNRFPALFSTNMGTSGAHIAAGKKGVFSGYESTTYTDQNATDAVEEPHHIGLTTFGNGTMGYRSVAATITLANAASTHGQNYVGSITMNTLSDGSTYNFLAFSGGSAGGNNVDAAFRTASGNSHWLYGLDTNGSTFSNGAIRLGYAGLMVARNQAAGADVPLISLQTIASQTNTVLIGNPASVTTTTSPITGMNVGVTSMYNLLNTNPIFNFQPSDAAFGVVAASAVGAFATFSTYRADGTSAALTAVTLNDVLGQFRMAGYDGTNLAVGASFRCIAAEGWTNVPAHGTHAQMLTVPTGSQTLTEVLRIQANGGIQVNATTTTPVIGDILQSNKTSVIIYMSKTTPGLLVFLENNAATMTWTTLNIATAALVAGSGATAP